MSDVVTEKVVSIIASVKQLPREKVSADSTFQDLGIDSLDTVVLLSELEEQFEIVISDEDARCICTVHGVIEGVKKLAGDLSSESIPLAG
jgi:acyl carrier protein